MKGARDSLSAPLLVSLNRSRYRVDRLRFFFPAHAPSLPLFPCDHLRQPALLPRGRVLVNDVLLAGTIKELDRLSIRRLGLRTSGRANLPDSGAQLASLGAIGDSPGTGLTHALGGGPDSGHSNLSQ